MYVIGSGIVMYDVLGWRRAGLVLESTQSCIASVKERVALHIKRGFGRDNKETVSQLFASFFVKVSD
jgi:hypothetical protein